MSTDTKPHRYWHGFPSVDEYLASRAATVHSAQEPKPPGGRGMRSVETAPVTGTILDRERERLAPEFA